jgi:hypothetical protein
LPSAILNRVLKTFTSKLASIDAKIDWDDVLGEALFIALVPGFVGGLLLYAGVPLLWVLGVAAVIEAGHLWNSGFGG